MLIFLLCGNMVMGLGGEAAQVHASVFGFFTTLRTFISFEGLGMAVQPDG